MKRKWYFFAPLAIVAFAAFIAIGAAAVMLLWNWLLPPIFGWHAITFWQALGVLLLCRILFGGFGPHRGHGMGLRGRFGERMAERWMQMTPEEREQFRQGMRGRWGWGPPGGEGKEP